MGWLLAYSETPLTIHVLTTIWLSLTNMAKITLISILISMFINLT